MADGSRAPLHAGYPCLKKRAAVARTFDRGEDASLWQGHELLPGPLRRFLDAALDAKPPRGHVDGRRLEMVADKKEAIRSNPALDAFQRRLAVFRCCRHHLARFHPHVFAAPAVGQRISSHPQKRWRIDVQRNQLRRASLQIRDLVQIVVVVRKNTAGRKVEGTDGLDVSVGGEGEIGDGGCAAHNANSTIRSDMIVDRRTLAILPTHHPEMVPATGSHKDTLVRRLAKASEALQISRLEYYPFEQAPQFAERSPFFQMIQVVDKSVQIVGHEVPRRNSVP